jgi:hypothetical protein
MNDVVQVKMKHSSCNTKCIIDDLCESENSLVHRGLETSTVTVFENQDWKWSIEGESENLNDVRM